MKDLVERLRNYHCEPGHEGGRLADLLDEAADVLERMERELELTQAERHRAQTDCATAHNVITASRTELEATALSLNRCQERAERYRVERDALSEAVDGRDEQIKQLRTELQDTDIKMSKAREEAATLRAERDAANVNAASIVKRAEKVEATLRAENERLKDVLAEIAQGEECINCTTLRSENEALKENIVALKAQIRGLRGALRTIADGPIDLDGPTANERARAALNGEKE